MDTKSSLTMKVGAATLPGYREQLVDWLARAIVRRLLAEADGEREARG